MVVIRTFRCDCFIASRARAVSDRSCAGLCAQKPVSLTRMALVVVNRLKEVGLCGDHWLNAPVNAALIREWRTGSAASFTDPSGILPI